jgi:putative addiction module component (TIGR02574 family)
MDERNAMPEALPELDISWLTTAQRLELIARLWDSIPDSLEDLPIPDWHRHELERRLAAADANPQAGIPWKEAQAQLRG